MEIASPLRGKNGEAGNGLSNTSAHRRTFHAACMSEYDLLVPGSLLDLDPWVAGNHVNLDLGEGVFCLPSTLLAARKRVRSSTPGWGRPSKNIAESRRHRPWIYRPHPDIFRCFPVSKCSIRLSRE